jgi:hypothetical protein
MFYTPEAVVSGLFPIAPYHHQLVPAGALRCMLLAIACLEEIQQRPGSDLPQLCAVMGQRLMVLTSPDFPASEVFGRRCSRRLMTLTNCWVLYPHFRSARLHSRHSVPADGAPSGKPRQFVGVFLLHSAAIQDQVHVAVTTFFALATLAEERVQ